MLTEDRKGDGLALVPVSSTMPGWRVFPAMRRAVSSTLLRRRQLVEPKMRESCRSSCAVHPSQPVRQLSATTSRRVVLAKWLLVENIELFIFDEPTRGVDVAARVEIYQMIRDLADSGVAVLMISSEMPESAWHG